jgi:hypothetical protein
MKKTIRCPQCDSDYLIKGTCPLCGYVKPKAEKKPRKPKDEKTEEQLVHEYVNKVIRGKQSRGHVDQRFEYTKTGTAVNKDMWLDTDFFFSVVFQSSEQKYKFLEAVQKLFKFELEDFYETQVEIVNGLKLAQSMGIDLKKESAREYPYGSLDLRPYVLDDEEI